MLRGYWIAIITAVGWLILIGAAETPKQGAETKHKEAVNSQARSLQTVTPPTVQPIEAIQGMEYQNPCRQGWDNRNSDLCAQWKAADAAADAAYWAKWQLWIGIAGVGGLLVSLHLTRLALNKAADANGVAEKSLAQSKENAALDRRPWISINITAPEGLTFHPEFVHIKLVITIKNVGLTAAHNIRVKPDFILQPRSPTQELPPFFSDHLAQALSDGVAGLMLVPGEAVDREAGMKIFRRDFGSAFEGQTYIAPLIFVSVTYQSFPTPEVHQIARSYLLSECLEDGSRMIIAEYGDVPSEMLKLTDRGGGCAT